jgi:hypothetical protein
MKRAFRFADNRIDDSLANRIRRRRFAVFAGLIRDLPGPVRILDVGGEERFWRQMGFLEEPGIELVLLNLKDQEPETKGVVTVTGDARRIPFEDREFEVVFSNSVIEHLGTHADQRRMADEIRRVGRRFFVQTPNRRFPIEPHFMFPGFQYLPLDIRASLAQRFALGYHRRMPDRETALEAVGAIRLLTRRELRALFPDARIYDERMLGLVKSLVAYGGW